MKLTADKKELLDLIERTHHKELLAHARLARPENDDNYLEPCSGPILSSTEAYQYAIEFYGKGPDLIFFSIEPFGWGKFILDWWLNAGKYYSIKDIEICFVKWDNGSIIQNAGDGMVIDYTGNTIQYYESECYDNDIYKDVPYGVEFGDYFSKSIVPIYKKTTLLHLVKASGDEQQKT